MMSDMRDAFERTVRATWSDSYIFTRDTDGHYCDEVLDGMWWAWQAARAQSGQGVEPQNCPRCHSDSVGCDSSRELQVAEVNCGDCGFSLQAEVDEDTVIEMWNLVRTESCADYDEYADTRAELAEIDSLKLPQPPQEGE